MFARNYKTLYGKGAKQTFWVSLIVAGVFFGFLSRYKLVFTPEGQTCFVYKYYLVDKWDREIERGEYFAFTTLNIPKFRDGNRFIKMAVGMPGDTVEVSDRVTVAGKDRGYLHPEIIKKLTGSGDDVKKFYRTETVGENQIYAWAEFERAYDSRYWGNVETRQVFGRVYPIW